MFGIFVREISLLKQLKLVMKNVSTIMKYLSISGLHGCSTVVSTVGSQREVCEFLSMERSLNRFLSSPPATE